jgi:uncharacterized membrane protein YedE/YeeE
MNTTSCSVVAIDGRLTQDEMADNREGNSASQTSAQNLEAVVIVRDEKEASSEVVNQVKCEVSKPKEVEKTWLDIAGLMFTAICMGLLFGAAMERGQVTPPVTIRKQFIFTRFVMIKMFLSASAFGALCFSILSVVLPGRFEPVRGKFISSRAARGLVPVVVGTFLLGCGMTVSGACPGMVFIQLGAGIENAIITLIGGMTGAMSFGLVQPFIASFLSVGCSQKQKVDDFPAAKSIKYWQLGLGLAVCMVIPIVLFEYFFKWDSASELGSVSLSSGGLGTFAPWSQAWPPLLSGVLIGSLQIPAVLIASGTVGSSSTYMTVVSQLLVTPSLQTRFKHLDGFRSGISMWQSVLYIWTAALGAYIASSAGGTFGKSRGVPPGPAFIGGFLMLFGSRMAGGCTSGHGLSGMALLSLQSILGVPAMFAGGIVTAFVYNAVDPVAFITSLE